MSVIFLLIMVSTLVATVFLAAFIRAVRKGQYDDDRSPAVRILLDDGVRRENAGARVQACEGTNAVDPRTLAPFHSSSHIGPPLIHDRIPDTAAHAKTTTP